MSEYDPNHIPKHVYFLLCAKVIIVNSNNEILLLQRSDKTPRPHGWDFAGGGVDKGEDPRDTVIRESLEETGLSIDNVQILSTSHGHTDGGEYIMIGYVARTNDNEVQLSWEHESYKWMTVEEVQQIELPQAHRLIIDAYLAQRS